MSRYNPGVTTTEEHWLSGGGDMGARIREFDWRHTSLGPVGEWPQSLKTAVRIMLGSRYPMFIWWGPDLINLYNDAYRTVLGKRHPSALGRRASEVWSEIWHVVGREAEQVLHHGQATWNSAILLVMERNGYTEETYFTWSYSPATDDEGHIKGVFCACTEDTARVLSERRMRTLREIAAEAFHAKTTGDACRSSLKALARNAHDVPFALLYVREPERRLARLAGLAGLTGGTAITPDEIALSEGRVESTWPIHRVLEEGCSLCVSDLVERVGKLPAGPWPEAPTQAMLLPINQAGLDKPVGCLITGISPRREFDEQYRDFLDLLAGQVSTAMANARGYEQERERAEALAELDRAKTAFFSNVSHEFRTPLTLMLGPLEDLLRSSDTTPAARTELHLLHRNSLRLLKLVNTLLAFSRIEAGRVQASYEPTDLATFTTELAGIFRAAIDRAGLRLLVDCPPLDEPVYVDRDMWEKIVLNLLSNAFKFTFAGEIAVTLTTTDRHAVLAVRDTGIGIARDELPRVFDRFHRIEGAHGRTHEGTGIGLALVRELAGLHGGTVEAESVPGLGSTFLVRIPLGTHHLPANHITTPLRDNSEPALDATSFVEEALRWLPGSHEDRIEQGGLSPEGPGAERASQPSDPGRQPVSARPRVLLADDNSDMRGYVERLLVERYEVTAVADGEAALLAVKQDPPDLVLTDVMMPRLDGFGLLRRLRADDRFRHIPVIMLSARAGEESCVKGLDAGADDYLIKPFSARELSARVGAHLNLARMRRDAQNEIARSKLFLERIAASTPDMLYVFDLLQGRNVYINRSLESVLGYSADDTRSMACEQLDAFVYPDDLPGVKAWYARFDQAADGEVLEHELRARHADGSHRWILARATVFERTSDGRAKQIVGVASDITERKQSEDKNRQFFNLSNALLVEAGFDGRLHRINPAWEKVLGWTVQELTARPWLDFVHPDDRAATVAAGERLVNGFEVIKFDNRYRHKDGSYRWIRWNTSPSRAHRLIWGVAEDVTERKRSEEALRASEERLRLSMAAGRMGAWEIDLETGAIIWDARQYELFGLSSADQPKAMEEFYRLVHPDDVERVKQAAATASSTGRLSEEFRILRPDGTVRWIAGAGSTVVNEEGRAVRMIGVNYDITERKTTEEALRASEERMRSFTEQLEQLVAERTEELMASQERLRALATELNLTEQRERRRIASELHDYLAQMLVLGRLKLGQAKRVSGVVPQCADLIAQAEDVLNESLLYTRTLVAELSPPVLHEFGLPAALKWLADRMTRQDLHVAVHLDWNDALRLPENQAVLLFQSVRELLINSAKHARTKEVSVRLEVLSGELSIRVEDRGRGFDPAAQAAFPESITAESSKFGLFSIRERMKAMGGRLDLSSAPDKGTTATLTLPLESAERKEPALQSAGPAPGPQRAAVLSTSHHAGLVTQPPELQDTKRVRVLLVDDHAMVRQGLRSVLESYPDVEVIGETWNGQEAVAMAGRLRPSLVVMDINMPRMNGIEATVEIKTRHPEIIVIGLSVQANAEAQEAMRQAGASRLLTKEAAVDELYRAARELLPAG